MSNDKYLEQISTLRSNYNAIYSPLFDFLEQYRPMEEFDGVVEFTSHTIKVIIRELVELEINDIAEIMVNLGYKTVYFDYEWYWNMLFVGECRKSAEEDV